MVSVFNSVQLKGLGFESWSSFSRPPSTFAHGWWVGQEFLLRWQQYQSNQWHQRRRSGTFFGASTVPLDQTLVFVKCHLLCFFLGFGGGAGRLMEVFLTLWVRRDFGEMIKAFCTTFCSETLKFTKSCCFQIDRFSWPKPRGFEMPVKEPFWFFFRVRCSV